MLWIAPSKWARKPAESHGSLDNNIRGSARGLQTGTRIAHNLSRNGRITLAHWTIDYRGTVRDDVINRPGGGSKQGLK
jgi:hypothetical protein